MAQALMIRKSTNYYQMLGVEPEVSTSEIKKAYRRMAKSHHPDIGHHGQTVSQRTQANEFMVQLNEAYETLIDKRRREQYDSSIGANGHGRSMRGKAPTVSLDEGEVREKYLRQIFNPSRAGIVKVLAKYKQQLSDLSQDIYDDELVQNFEIYLEEIEQILRKSSNGFSSRPTPQSLVPAVQMMRYSIAQAVDGLDEARRFCQNYDYVHLHMAGNLFREATDLARKAQQLTKRC
jgi:molecular chaperone DnaJ